MLWTALQDRRFARLFYATLISQIGTQIDRIALLVLVYQQTRDALWVSLMLGVQLAATLILSPILSAWAENQERRRLLVLSDLLRAPLVALIPLVGLRSLPALIGLLIALEALRLLHDPVAQSVIPELIPPDRLDSANSLMLFTQRFAEVAFVGLAGILVAAVGPASAFWIDAASYALSGLLLLKLPRLEAAAPARVTYWVRVREGMGHIVGQPIIRRTIGTLVVAAMFGSMELVLGIVLAVSVLRVGSTGFGLMEAAIALGAVIGLALVPSLTTRLPRERLFFFSLLAFGLFEASIGAWPNFFWVLIAYFMTGLLNMLFLIPARTLLQLHTPPELRTRVFAAFGALMRGAVLVGTIAGGALEPALGAPLVIIVAGLFVTGVSAWALWRGGIVKQSAEADPSAEPRLA
ncbi:MAG: MFS transporter [Chloroflexi bacterium]|nr:MFS transporter [Chloroflexota bacterium]